jgi:hypothetical protein
MGRFDSDFSSRKEDKVGIKALRMPDVTRGSEPLGRGGSEWRRSPVVKVLQPREQTVDGRTQEYVTYGARCWVKDMVQELHGAYPGRRGRQCELDDLSCALGPECPRDYGDHCGRTCCL